MVNHESETLQSKAAKAVAKMLHDAHVAYQKQQLRGEPKTSYVNNGIESPEVRGLRYKPQAIKKNAVVIAPTQVSAYYKVFCAHDRMYIETCTQCRRDKREAVANAVKLKGL